LCGLVVALKIQPLHGLIQKWIINIMKG
jgi:hypothetical protein